MKTPTSPTTPRRWMQFSLLSLLLVITVASVPLSVLAYWRNSQRQPLVNVIVHHDGASATEMDMTVAPALVAQLEVLDRVGEMQWISSPGETEFYIRAYPATRRDDFLSSVQGALAAAQSDLPAMATVGKAKLLPSATQFPIVDDAKEETLRIQVNHERAIRLGIVSVEAAAQIQQLIKRHDAGKLTGLELESATLTNSQGLKVPLREVAEITLETQPTRIVRRSTAGE